MRWGNPVGVIVAPSPQPTLGSRVGVMLHRADNPIGVSLNLWGLVFAHCKFPLLKGVAVALEVLIIPLSFAMIVILIAAHVILPFGILIRLAVVFLIVVIAGRIGHIAVIFGEVVVIGVIVVKGHFMLQSKVVFVSYALIIL